MNLIQAQQLARSLMNKHGLNGWILEFDNAKTRAGLTRFNQVTISLSRPFVQASDEADVRNVILHEVAHVLAGVDAGHGPLWVRTAKSIGCSGERCQSMNVDLRADAPWVPVCPAGHRGTGFLRAPGRVRACRICCKGTFRLQHRMTWEFNGKPMALSQMPVKYQKEWKRQG